MNEKQTLFDLTRQHPSASSEELIAHVPPRELGSAVGSAMVADIYADLAVESAGHAMGRAEYAVERSVATGDSYTAAGASERLGLAAGDYALANMMKETTKVDAARARAINETRVRVARLPRVAASLAVATVFGLGTAGLIHGAQTEMRKVSIANVQAFNAQHPEMAMEVPSKKLDGESHIINGVLSSLVVVGAGTAANAFIGLRTDKTAHKRLQRRQRRHDKKVS